MGSHLKVQANLNELKVQISNYCHWIKGYLGLNLTTPSILLSPVKVRWLYIIDMLLKKLAQALVC